MHLIDDQLRAQGVPIHTRPMRAESILAVKLGESFVHPYPKRAPVAHVYTGHDLTIRVAEWFDQQYGERLKMDFSPGSTVILVRNDCWVMRLPRFFGTWRITTNDGPSDLDDDELAITRAGDEPINYNCLRCIVDMPDAFRNSLRSGERAEILTRFNGALDAYHAFENMPKGPLVSQASADVSAALGHLAAQSRNPALSKWSSLQAAEKILKAYLRFQGVVFPLVHDLETLATLAEQAGLSTIDRSVLKDIQCEPRVRYGEIDVPIHEAVRAHHQSLAVVRHVANGLGVASIFAPQTETR